MTDAPPNRAQRTSAIRSPLDFAGGLFLLGIAAVGYAGAFTLPFGQLSGIGSGLLPGVEMNSKSMSQISAKRSRTAGTVFMS